MDDHFYTETGGIIEYEDILSMALVKVPELINEGFTISEIEKFYDVKVWSRIARSILDKHDR